MPSSKKCLAGSWKPPSGVSHPDEGFFVPVLCKKRSTCPLDRLHLASRNLAFFSYGNRFELLIVTLTLPAITDSFRRKINIHNIMDWLHPLTSKDSVTTFPPRKQYLIKSNARHNRAEGPRTQPGAKRPRQGLESLSPPLRPDGAVLRQDLAVARLRPREIARERKHQ